jgi:hypothetical protein
MPPGAAVAATIPNSVNIPAGQNSANVNVTTLPKVPNSVSTIVNVTATLNGSKAAALTITSQKLT